MSASQVPGSLNYTNVISGRRAADLSNSTLRAGLRWIPRTGCLLRIPGNHRVQIFNSASALINNYDTPPVRLTRV